MAVKPAVQISLHFVVVILWFLYEISQLIIRVALDKEKGIIASLILNLEKYMMLALIKWFAPAKEQSQPEFLKWWYLTSSAKPHCSS